MKSSASWPGSDVEILEKGPLANLGSLAGTYETSKKEHQSRENSVYQSIATLVEVLRYLTTMPTRTLRVLVVEDEPTNREIAEVILTSQGHLVTSCRTGQEALDIIVGKGEQFDVILMDVLMPGMDGLEVTRRIRAHPPSQDVPVICVSAKASGSDYAAGMASGANAYLRKPSRRRELLQAIDDVLKVAPAGSPDLNGRRPAAEVARPE